MLNQGTAVPSADIRGRGVAKNGQAARWYIRMTRIIHLYLSILMQRVFPEEYKKYKTAFEKACWTCDEGCWIGRSVVWKCQVDLHLDGGDGVLGICAILNCGFYVPANASHLGTSAVYPDLNMAFA